MQDLIREHDREIRLAHTQTSAVSEHDYNTGHPPLWNEVTFIDRDPHSFTRRVKESIHMRIHSDNIDTTIPTTTQQTFSQSSNSSLRQFLREHLLTSLLDCQSYSPNHCSVCSSRCLKPLLSLLFSYPSA